MKGSDYFVLASSFCMGAFAGFFFYVTVFAPSYSTENDIDAINENARIIEGQMYGGCERMGSCASFRLEEDSSYRYFKTENAEVAEGKIPRDLSRNIFATLTTDDFVFAADTITPTSCNSFMDGVDYRYFILNEGESYTLDTCTSALAYDEMLQKSFLEVWAFMDNPTTTYPVIIEKGIGGFFIDRFQNSDQ